MRRIAFIWIAGLGVAATALAQSPDIRFTQIRGHFIGESLTSFLSSEPEARLKVSTCRLHSGAADCRMLLAAVDRGERGELTTSDASDFVMEQGKLVRMSSFVDGIFDGYEKFGPAVRKSVIRGENGSGEKWEDELSQWNSSDVSVTLLEDHDPSLQKGRRRLLVVECMPGSASQYTVSVKQLSTAEVGSNITPAR